MIPLRTREPASARGALERFLGAVNAGAMIFDMDGTLVDNMEVHDRAWIQWARNEGISESEDQILAKAHGTISEALRRFFPEERDARRLRALAEKKEALYREWYRPHLKLMPGLTDCLDAARAASVKLALATAGDEGNVAFTVDGLAIRDRFAAIVSAEHVKKGKPDPEVFLLAAAGLEMPPGRCVVFEDSPSGVEAARRAGMPCVVVNPRRPRSEFGDTSHVRRFISHYGELISP